MAYVISVQEEAPYSIISYYHLRHRLRLVKSGNTSVLLNGAAARDMLTLYEQPHGGSPCGIAKNTAGGPFAIQHEPYVENAGNSTLFDISGAATSDERFLFRPTICPSRDGLIPRVIEMTRNRRTIGCRFFFRGPKVDFSRGSLVRVGARHAVVTNKTCCDLQKRVLARPIGSYTAAQKHERARANALESHRHLK